MEHLYKIYNNDKNYFDELINCDNVKVNLKVDGKPFQVYYNEDADIIEYRDRSGNETTVGPLMDNYKLLFSPYVNKAVRYFDTKIDILKNWKFLTFEIVDDNILLTSVIDKEGRFINDSQEIRSIANELGTDVMPTLYEGKFTECQKNTIKTMITDTPTKQDFINVVKEMFASYKYFPDTLIKATEDFIEGIVFFFDINGKIVEYKIVDPSFIELIYKRKDSSKIQYEKNEDIYNELYEQLYDVIYDAVNYLDFGKETRQSHIEDIFEYIKNNTIYNSLSEIVRKLDIERIPRYTLQLDRLVKPYNVCTQTDKDILTILFKILYKKKTRTYILSKEFQKKLNNIIDRI